MRESLFMQALFPFLFLIVPKCDICKRPVKNSEHYWFFSFSFSHNNLAPLKSSQFVNYHLINVILGLNEPNINNQYTFVYLIYLNGNHYKRLIKKYHTFLSSFSLPEIVGCDRSIPPSYFLNICHFKILHYCNFY